MKLYRNAEVIVFPEGSACHGVELLGAKAADVIVFIPRREDHRSIFGCVLSPRSKEYLSLPLVDSMGSILNQWQHETLSLIDFKGLFDVLRVRGFLGVTPFNVRRYIEACETDFMRYVRHFLGLEPAIIDPERIAAAHRYLARRFTEMNTDGYQVPGLDLWY